MYNIIELKIVKYGVAHYSNKISGQNFGMLANMICMNFIVCIVLNKFRSMSFKRFGNSYQ